MDKPKDNEEARHKYNDMCCGQSVLAVIENISVEKAMQNWINLLGEWKGYSPFRDMRKYLESRGYLTKRVKVNKVFFEDNKFYICRVQWIGKGEKRDKPYYGWEHWRIAIQNTHYILIHNNNVFCNSAGIFGYNRIADYLGDIRQGEIGKITSILEVIKHE